MKQETVILLHGIGHTRWNMAGMEGALQKAGYATFSITYPSLRRDLAGNADFVHDRLAAENIWERSARVHFVTHSMGGLVARTYLEKNRQTIPPEKMGRVVMLAPPNGGSEVADFLHNLPPYQWVYGPAGQELTTAARAKDSTAPWYDIGIIAGTGGWLYPVANFIIPGGGKAHDGRVSINHTKLKGMKDFATVDATHSFIAWRKDVQEMVVEFLREGYFISQRHARAMSSEALAKEEGGHPDHLEK